MERRIDAAMIERATPEIIAAHLKELEEVMTRLKIKPANTYGFDENGTALGVAITTRVVVSSEKKTARVQAQGDRKWVTTVGCTCAAIAKRLDFQSEHTLQPGIWAVQRRRLGESKSQQTESG